MSSRSDLVLRWQRYTVLCKYHGVPRRPFTFLLLELNFQIVRKMEQIFDV